MRQKALTLLANALYELRVVRSWEWRFGLFGRPRQLIVRWWHE